MNYLRGTSIKGCASFLRGGDMKIGDIVEVNGQPRIVTCIDGDRFFSSPVSDDVSKAEVEITKVEKPVEKVVARRKKKD